MTKKTDETKNTEEIVNAVAVSETGKELSTEMESFFDLDEEAALITPDITFINFVSGAACQFKTETERFSEFTAFIGHLHYANVYWDKPFSERTPGERPPCSSSDAIKPNMNSSQPQSDECATCPLNQHGSKPGRKTGKACSNRVVFYVFRANLPTKELAKINTDNDDGNIISYFSNVPEILSCPPSAIKPLKQLISTLGKRKTSPNKGTSFKQIPVCFYLIPGVNNDGIEFSQVQFKPVEPAVTQEEMPEAWSRLLSLHKQWREKIAENIKFFSENDFSTE